MIEGRRIWLTGASSGIGAHMAKELLQRGAFLALSARTLGPLAELSERFPGKVLLVPGDMTDHLQVREIGMTIAQTWGALDTVILNAGSCEYVDVRQFDARVIERVVSTNLLGSSYCIESALPLLRAGRSPHLVGVVSSVTYWPLPRAQAYGASKAGLRYLLESLRIDLAHEGIDVTVVSPGFVDTPLTEKNDFPMPMRWSAPKAALYICQRLEKRPLEISFPTVFIVILKLLASLPKRLQVAIGKRLARTSDEPSA
ncbi:SDR family NAD(P)-dependent oxidoreductase [Pseudomonas sp. NPDC096917]|uniref:SDR family NAD(P)-dependent oxidoreductase n=1 Tax=Pseudomonas sp. NPDC096917 TaxID=3364483 RepID=UPI00383AB77D